MNASQIPERDLEMTAHAVRLIRAAPEGTRAADIERDMAAQDPGAEDAQIRRCLGYAARMMTR